MRCCLFFLVLVLILGFGLYSWAPSANPLADIELTPGHGPAGFFTGLWHGFILPVSFVISLFDAKVGIYETHNNGPLYNLGYVIGAVFLFGGGAESIRRDRERPRSEPKREETDL